MNQQPKKIYISGQITGLPIEKAKFYFKAAEYILISKGYNVVNPMALPEHDAILKSSKSQSEQWIEHMKVDIKALMDCDSIYILKNWRNSRGARVEVDLAIELNYDILYEEE